MTVRSATQTMYRAQLDAFLTLLRREQAQGRTLAQAEEIRIGLHAEDGSWKPCGIYILPGNDRPEDVETGGAWQHTLHLKVIASSRIETWTGDNDEADLGTSRLMDLVGGVLDLVKNNRDLTTTSFLVLNEEIDFLILRAEGAYYYRAEVPVTLHVSM